MSSGVSVSIRAESANDHGAVFELNTLAFGQRDEAQLVDAMRSQAVLAAAFVATLREGAAERVVGHIAFSKVTVDPPRASTAELWGLAPMAVDPELQRAGIGARLVEHGIQHARAVGVGALIVLGHHTYYPRFGFDRASKFGLRWNHPAPDEAFMAMELRQGALAPAPGPPREGVVRYHDLFEGL